MFSEMLRSLQLRFGLPNEFTLMGTVLIYVIEKTVGKADASCEMVSKHL